MAKALKGFRIKGIFPVTTNDATTYAVGTMIPIVGAQSMSFTPETQEWTQYADDGIYDSGSDFLGMNFTLQLAECPIELKRYFEGGEYNETTGEYTFHSDDQAPEIGMIFAALLSDNTYLGVKLYSLKCNSYSNSFNTKGESGEANPITIEGTIMTRKKDNAVKREKVITTFDDTWLNTLADA